MAGVADVLEVKKLRRAGIELPILVMGLSRYEDIATLVAFRTTIPESFPRINIGCYPAPFYLMKNLSNKIGVNLFIKGEKTFPVLE